MDIASEVFVVAAQGALFFAFLRVIPWCGPPRDTRSGSGPKVAAFASLLAIAAVAPPGPASAGPVAAAPTRSDGTIRRLALAISPEVAPRSVRLRAGWSLDAVAADCARVPAGYVHRLLDPARGRPAVADLDVAGRCRSLVAAWLRDVLGRPTRDASFLVHAAAASPEAAALVVRWPQVALALRDVVAATDDATDGRPPGAAVARDEAIGLLAAADLRLRTDVGGEEGRPRVVRRLDHARAVVRVPVAALHAMASDADWHDLVAAFEARAGCGDRHDGDAFARLLLLAAEHEPARAVLVELGGKVCARVDEVKLTADGTLSTDWGRLAASLSGCYSLAGLFDHGDDVGVWDVLHCGLDVVAVAKVLKLAKVGSAVGKLATRSHAIGAALRGAARVRSLIGRQTLRPGVARVVRSLRLRRQAFAALAGALAWRRVRGAGCAGVAAVVGTLSAAGRPTLAYAYALDALELAGRLVPGCLRGARTTGRAAAALGRAPFRTGHGIAVRLLSGLGALSRVRVGLLRGDALVADVLAWLRRSRLARRVAARVFDLPTTRPSELLSYAASYAAIGVAAGRRGTSYEAHGSAAR